jgi:hypothetical protein
MIEDASADPRFFVTRFQSKICAGRIDEQGSWELRLFRLHRDISTLRAGSQ